MLYFSRPSLRIVLTVCAMLFGVGTMLATPASAEIKKVMLQCSGKLCPVFLPQLSVPRGWTVDQATSEANHLTVLVPTGADFGSAEAVIYGRAYYNAEKTTIRSRAETSNSKWLAATEGAGIEQLADVARAKGGPAFEVFQYRNPKNVQQAAEIVAFGEETDKQGNLYGIQIVLTAGGEQALADNKAALLTVLKDY